MFGAYTAVGLLLLLLFVRAGRETVKHPAFFVTKNVLER